MNLERAYEIYDHFLDIVLDEGWNGEKYSFEESIRGNPVTGDVNIHFRLDNGFNMQLVSETCEEEKKVSFQYWFDDKENERRNVNSSMQLILLMM